MAGFDQPPQKIHTAGHAIEIGRIVLHQIDSFHSFIKSTFRPAVESNGSAQQIQQLF